MVEILRIELLLEDLDCANCATKIEEKVREIDEVKTANLNFITKILTIEPKEKNTKPLIVESVKAIVNKYEPHVKVKEKKNRKADKEDSIKNKGELIRLAIGVIFFGAAIGFKLSFWSEFTLFFISYILIGGEVLLKAIKNIFRGQVFDENFLMAVATVGAFAIGEFPEGVAVMLFYQIGEFMQDLAVNRSRKSIAQLMDIRPDYANLVIEKEVKKVSPESVKVGSIILVKPGEKIPLDGIVIEGTSMVDTSALTGESVPREVKEESEVLSGFINKNGVLTIKVSKEFAESTVAKILDLVENASSKKAPTENFITKFARYYTPIVVFGALAVAVIPPLVIDGAEFSHWFYRALIFLVISCPCALVVSIPLGFFGGIGGASKNGILIKGGNYLEALNNVDTIVFDKTGTLTKGVFKVTDIIKTGKLSSEEILEYAAYAESYSNHPIATSILKAYGKSVDQSEIDKYEEISGRGIKVSISGKEILAGNDKLMEEHGVQYSVENSEGTIIHILINKKHEGYIVISDEIKEDSQGAIENLKTIGVNKTVMLTGDRNNVAKKVGDRLGIDKVFGELLPQNKVEKLEELNRGKKTKGKLIFVGDGINDAPVLARADIGVAMGGLGSDAAIEAADVVLMTDEPSKLVTAIKIAQKTKSIVWQNIIFSLGVKGIVLMLGAIGYATMWSAVFADVGVALIAVLNAMRVLNLKNI